MEFIALRFTGNDVAPGNTRCKDVATLISATESLIEALSAQDDDEDEDEINSPVCLVAVENKSLGLKFSAAHMFVALAAWQDVAAAVNTGEFNSLPSKAKTCLEEIVHFVKKRQCVAELSDSKHPGTVLASMTPETVLPKNLKLSGTTSIIGTVVRVGGSEPKVGLKLANGKTLTCDTSEIIAKQLGHRLYDIVTCKGEACWDIDSNSVTKFRIKEVGSFRQGLASEAFSNLSGSMPQTLHRWRAEGLENIFPEGH